VQYFAFTSYQRRVFQIITKGLVND